MADTAAHRPAATPGEIARLDAIILASPAAGLTPEQAEEVRGLLRGASLEQIVEAATFAANRVSHAVAAGLYQAWIAANGSSPHLFAAWFNLGASFAQLEAHGTAATCFRNALALKPDFHAAGLNLGLVLEKAGDADAALDAWEKALQPDEARLALLNQRARLLEQLKRFEAAERTMRTSLLIDPQQPDVIQHWVHVRQKMCLWPVLPDDMPGLPRAELARHCGPLGALALTDDVAAQRAVTETWIARKIPPAPGRLSPPEGYRHDRLRVGYMSSDFCNHAMAFLIAGVFEQHDRARVEVFGYDFSREDGSAIRARIVGAFDHHVPIASLSDEEAARRIRADEIDVLVDLNGLTAGARLGILRWKPAPVQATYLGFVGPVALPELDYLFCDDFVVPPDVAGQYAPAPLPIAANYQANDAKRSFGAALTRAENGLPDDRFVFCCFSNHYKITEAMFATWAAILRQAGDSVLWMAVDAPDSVANMRARAAALGIDPARLIFAERVDPQRYMRRLALADLFLDTFPYNAGTVASDAIRMQLPLVTLCGRAFASRMAGRLLTAIGAGAGVASTMEEYQRIAVSLATDPAEYRRYKALFTEGAWGETMGDVARFTAEYEATLLRIRRAP